jgi:hypothetical protein
VSLSTQAFTPSSCASVEDKQKKLPLLGK